MHNRTVRLNCFHISSHVAVYSKRPVVRSSSVLLCLSAGNDCVFWKNVRLMEMPLVTVDRVGPRIVYYRPIKWGPDPGGGEFYCPMVFDFSTYS